MKQQTLKALKQQNDIAELIQMFFTFFGGALGLFVIALLVEMIA